MRESLKQVRDEWLANRAFKVTTPPQTALGKGRAEALLSCANRIAPFIESDSAYREAVKIARQAMSSHDKYMEDVIHSRPHELADIHYREYVRLAWGVVQSLCRAERNHSDEDSSSQTGNSS